MGRGRRRKQSTHTNELLIKQMLKQALLKFVLLNSEFSLLYYSLPCPLSFPRSLHFTSNSSNKEEAITVLNLGCRGGGLGQESPQCGHQKVQYFLTWLRLKPCPNFHAGSMAEKNRNAKQKALPRSNSGEVKPYPSPTHSPHHVPLWNTKSFSMRKDQKFQIILDSSKTLPAMNSSWISPKLSILSNTCGQQYQKIGVVNEETATAFQTKMLLNHLKKPPSKGHANLMSVFGMGCVEPCSRADHVISKLLVPPTLEPGGFDNGKMPKDFQSRS